MRYAETPLLERLDRDEVVVGDGAMGSLLYERGVPFAECFEALCLRKPDIVRQIHADYLAAGARLLETNSFRANGPALARHGLEKQAREISRAAASLAKEVAKGEAYVAGAVGPIGRVQPGKEEAVLSPEEREAIYAETIAGLVEGGVDLVLIETMLNLEDAGAAYRAARKVSKLPVVVQFAYVRHAVTYEGLDLSAAARAMAEAGADVLGGNCGRGPSGAPEFVKRYAEEGVRRISAFPNAGFPDYVEGRYLYASDPDYFARRMVECVDLGARLVGGCCGTGPEDVRALARLLQWRKARGIAPAPRPPLAPRPPASAPARRAAASPGAAAPALPRTHFLDELPRRKAVTVELDPPKGIDYGKVVEGAIACREAGADAISIAENPLAIVRMSNLVLGHIVQRDAGIEAIVHFCGRDRNLLGTRSALMGAAALGIRTIFCITGDPASIGDCSQATSVYDLNSFTLVALIAAMNRGESPGAPPGGFRVGGAVNPNKRNLAIEVKRLKKKVEMGATFAQSQAVYDPALARETHRLAREMGIAIPILYGIMPFANLRNAEFIANEIPGIAVPPAVIERMRGAKDPAAEGLAIAREVIDRTIDFADGYYLLPPFNRAPLAVELIRHVRAWERERVGAQARG
ncbi:MAG TPA: bifunctional homocysteine S-methyltransferase/methylenetetrahydrofolate reductase [Planctomycetota bacterium]|jgi:homocysteine S-methyltransferase|nr:bifunctional homocysteine S-methyltransferase/methylenetetrahydrofolate reductase [Planctomycetota bacterium]